MALVHTKTTPRRSGKAERSFKTWSVELARKNDEGLGIQIYDGAAGLGHRVCAVRDGSIAAKSARIHLDDVLVSVNKADTLHLPHQEVLRLIATAGSSVVLEFADGDDVDAAHPVVDVRVRINRFTDPSVKIYAKRSSDGEKITVTIVKVEYNRMGVDGTRSEAPDIEPGDILVAVDDINIKDMDANRLDDLLLRAIVSVELLLHRNIRKEKDKRMHALQREDSAVTESSNDSSLASYSKHTGTRIARSISNFSLESSIAAQNQAILSPEGDSASTPMTPLKEVHLVRANRDRYVYVCDSKRQLRFGNCCDT